MIPYIGVSCIEEHYYYYSVPAISTNAITSLIIIPCPYKAASISDKLRDTEMTNQLMCNILTCDCM